MSGRGRGRTAAPLVPAETRADHFLVELGPKEVYHYNVTITPRVSCTSKSRKIMRLLCESCQLPSHLAYDGKESAFAARALPFVSQEFIVRLTEQEGVCEFKVRIKFDAINKSDGHPRRKILAWKHDCPQDIIRALNVVFRDCASDKKSCITVAPSLCDPEYGEDALGDGLEFWKGLYERLLPSQMGLSVNINACARAFSEPMFVSDFVAEFLGKDISRPLSDQQRLTVDRALSGVKIVALHVENLVRGYKVQGLTAQPLNQLTFADDTGTTITVAQYFCDKYNLKLQFSFLPAIQAWTKAGAAYLPMEICKLVTGQRFALKLNEKQMTSFLEAICQHPKESIRNLMYDGPEVYPLVGDWNMIDLKMVNGGTVDYWAIANFSMQWEQHEVRHFCDKLVQMCVTKGMVFNPEPLIRVHTASPHNIEKALVDTLFQCNTQLMRVAPRNQLQMLFVILPEDEEKGTYSTIKRVCETELGIVFQCCRPQHVMKPSRKYLENMALKINVKVGDRNTVLSAALNGMLPYVTDRLTIIFGADMTHPSPGELPSIAAVVASMDWPEVTKYEALVSAQLRKEEIIQDLYTTSTDSEGGIIHGGLIRELLISFKKSTGHKPERIIFYRIGASESQFNEVPMNEVDKIRKACTSLQPDYMPPVTYVVVQKNHNTRFFSSSHDDRGSTDKCDNIQPGTVVDNKICHPEFDFYLCSHDGIQGKSPPTRYHVLYDENKITADDLQTLTKSLCYTFARCSRSVSIVPPAYYARLAAFRARTYMEEDLPDNDSRGSHTRDNADVVKFMFYC